MCSNVMDRYISCKKTKGVSHEKCIKIFQEVKKCIYKYN